MNKIEKNKSENIKPGKTPQWIRDIAAGSKLNKNDIASKNSSKPLIAAGNFNIKKPFNSAKKHFLDNPKEQMKYTDHIKKARERLLKIDELKREADNRNIKIEKSIEQEEKNIEQKIIKRFKT